MHSDTKSADSNHVSESQAVTSTNRARTRRAVSPLAGLLAFSAILVTAFDVLHVARRAEAAQAQAAEVTREVRSARTEIDLLRGQIDKVAGDVRDVRSVLLKERVRLASVEAKFDGLSEQLKAQEQRVLCGLAADQKRYARTGNEINELRKTADQNASNISKVAVSLADIASFMHQTELEHGVPPERGKESSKRVNALRDSALGVWQSIYKSR